MKVFVVVANNEYESNECVIGVFTTFDKAQESKGKVKDYAYVDIYEGELDKDEFTLLR